MSARRFSIGIGVLAMQWIVGSTALAAPVPCPFNACAVSDAGTTLRFEGGALVGIDVFGIDQLAQQGLFVTLGANSPGNPLTGSSLASTYSLISATQDEDANQIVVVFSDNSTLSFTLTYTLTGGPLTATIPYTVLVQNLSGNSQALALMDFIDFDLMDDSTGDTVVFTAPDTITQTGKGATATARSISAFAYQDVGECCVTSTLSRLVSGHLSGDVGPVGPDDVSGSFQDDLQVAAAGSFTISRQLQVTIPAQPRIAPAPALSPLALGGALLTLAGIAATALRRRARAFSRPPAGRC